MPFDGRTRPYDGERAQPDPVPRAVAIYGLVGVAAIHFAQVVEATEQTPFVGAGFVMLTVACAALAARLLNGESRAVWVQVAGVNALAIGGYVFTRSFSTFIDNQDAGNWSEMLGLVALLVEGLLLLLTLRQIKASRSFVTSSRSFAGAARGREDSSFLREQVLSGRR